jgi:hypothetical protein
MTEKIKQLRTFREKITLLPGLGFIRREQRHLQLLDIDNWREPGIRHKGLSQETLSAFNNYQGFFVWQYKDNTYARNNHTSLRFDNQGRLVDKEIYGENPYLETHRVRYDHWGRVTRYNRIRNYDIMRGDFYSATYTYQSDNDNAYSVEESESLLIGPFGGP